MYNEYRDTHTTKAPAFCQKNMFGKHESLWNTQGNSHNSPLPRIGLHSLEIPTNLPEPSFKAWGTRGITPHIISAIVENHENPEYFNDDIFHENSRIEDVMNYLLDKLITPIENTKTIRFAIHEGEYFLEYRLAMAYCTESYTVYPFCVNYILDFPENEKEIWKHVVSSLVNHIGVGSSIETMCDMFKDKICCYFDEEDCEFSEKTVDEKLKIYDDSISFIDSAISIKKNRAETIAFLKKNVDNISKENRSSIEKYITVLESGFSFGFLVENVNIQEADGWIRSDADLFFISDSREIAIEDTKKEYIEYFSPVEEIINDLTMSQEAGDEWLESFSKSINISNTFSLSPIKDFSKEIDNFSNGLELFVDFIKTISLY